MIEQLTPDQITSAKLIVEKYREYAENDYYQVEKVEFYAHPKMETSIFILTEVSGIESGVPFSRTKYYMIDPNGVPSDSKHMFNSKEDRRSFYKELINVFINDRGKFEIK